MRAMRQWQWSVHSIASVGGLMQVTCFSPAVEIVPGQLCLAWTALPAQPFLRVPLYPFATPQEQFAFCLAPTHPYTALQPGDSLDVLGPVGQGFHLPAGTRNVLILASSLERVLGLIYTALQQQLAVALLTPRRWEHLPVEVEVQRGPLTAELAQWADVVALDVSDPHTTAHKVRALCPTRPRHYVQALLTPTLPCGFGACQACWVEVGNTRKLGCETGVIEIRD